MATLSKSKNILATMDGSNGSSLIALYTPPTEVIEGDPPKTIYYDGLIEELKIRVKITSLTEVEAPSFPIESSSSERYAAIRDLEWRNPRYELHLFLQEIGSDPVQIGAVSLLNRPPFYSFSLLQYLGEGVAFRISQGVSLLAQFVNVGWGLPNGSDVVNIFGAVLEEAEYRRTTDLVAISRESFTVSAFGLRYVWDGSSQSSVDLIAGQLRFNNQVYASATAIYLNKYDRNQVDISPALTGFSSGGILQIQADVNPVNYHYFQATAAPVVSGNLITIAVDHLSGSGSFAGAISLSFGGAGQQGAQGIQGEPGDPGGPPGPQGDPGFSGFALPYTVDTGTTPTVGQLLLNNADPALATSIAVSKTAGAVSVASVLSYLANGTLIQISDQTDPLNNWAFFAVTSTANSTEYRTLAVNYLSHTGTIAGDSLLSFAPPGPQGIQGIQGEQGIQGYPGEPGFSATTRELWISAGAIVPGAIDGATPAVNSTTTNPATFDVLAFDSTTEKNGFFTVSFPQTWNAGTVKAKFYWSAATGTGDCVWGIQAGSVSDGVAIDQAFGTAQEVTDTLLAVDQLHLSSATAALTIGNTPAAGDLVQFRVYRKSSDEDDTLNAPAILLGVAVQFAETQSGIIW